MGEPTAAEAAAAAVVAARRDESRRLWRVVRRLSAGLAVVAIAVALLARDSGPTAELLALRADPMATYVPPGARPTNTIENDRGSAMGISHPATMLREFSVPAARADEAFQAAVLAARRAGWRSRGKPNTSRSDALGELTGWHAFRPEPAAAAAGPSSLAVLLLTGPDAPKDASRELQISLQQ